MHKIDSENATANNEFQDANPITQEDGTVIASSWLNTIQRELVNFVTSAGLSLNKNDDSQVRAALDAVLGALTIGTAKLVDLCVTTSKIASAAVTTVKIADGAVTQAKLASGVQAVPSDGSVTAAKIASGAVTDAKVATGISGSKISDNTITGAKFSSNSVTYGKMKKSIITINIPGNTFQYIDFNNTITGAGDFTESNSVFLHAWTEAYAGDPNVKVFPVDTNNGMWHLYAPSGPARTVKCAFLIS